MDLSVLAGFVTEEELREERPELLERLRKEGRLDRLRVTPTPDRPLWPVMVAGFAALAIGIALVAGTLLAAFGR